MKTSSLYEYFTAGWIQPAIFVNECLLPVYDKGMTLEKLVTRFILAKTKKQI